MVVLEDEKEKGAALPLEVAVVWAVFAVVAVEILVTYSRVPASELYHVSGSGLRGGASRALVFANFPTALVAIAILGVLAPRLSPAGRAVAAVGGVLSAAVAWPGVVDQADLDARPVNAIAAAGVAVALVLTVAVARRGIVTSPWRRVDALRLAVLTPLVLLALPWFAAELGFFLDGVPLLGRLFLTGPLMHRIAGYPPFSPAVHHGHHHGMDGLLLVATALLLWRTSRLHTALRAYLALMLCYGLGNIANDAWIEQVLKRGWTTWTVPDVLEPRATVAWGVIVVAAAIVYAVSGLEVPARRHAGVRAEGGDERARRPVADARRDQADR
jgi:drug/metabolite transporter superfamily protein YnfA